MKSFRFSFAVEALQTLIHIDHQDSMHHPVAVILLGAAGIVLNGICFLMIGGYTHHQGSFLHITSTGDVVLDGIVSDEGLRRGERRLSRTKRDQTTPGTAAKESKVSDITAEKRPTERSYILHEVFRDICSE